MKQPLPRRLGSPEEGLVCGGSGGREVADGSVSPQEAVRAYHGELQKQHLKPFRALQDDLAITETVLQR